MAETTHGIGGLTFDARKRSWPNEVNILGALILIVLVFEALGALLMGQSFLFDTQDRFGSIFNEQRLYIIILQVSIVGIIAIGVTQVIISGGIDLSSGSVVGAGIRVTSRLEVCPTRRRPSSFRCTCACPWNTNRLRPAPPLWDSRTRAAERVERTPEQPIIRSC